VVKLPVALMIATIGLLSRDHVRASTSPHLFGPRSSVEHSWSPDYSLGGSHYCQGSGGRQGSVCEYQAGSMHIGAIYGPKNQVLTFRLFQASNAISPRNWTFLVSLLPQGARLMKCGTVQKSDQGGPAKVCLYAYHFDYNDGNLREHGTDLVVAQYLHPGSGGDFGVVEPDDFHLGFAAVQQ
jgi:hypothetical protein